MANRTGARNFRAAVSQVLGVLFMAPVMGTVLVAISAPLVSAQSAYGGSSYGTQIYSAHNGATPSENPQSTTTATPQAASSPKATGNSQLGTQPNSAQASQMSGDSGGTPSATSDTGKNQPMHPQVIADAASQQPLLFWSSLVAVVLALVLAAWVIARRIRRRARD